MQTTREEETGSWGESAGEEQEIFTVGQEVDGRYVVLETIGRGGMGAVARVSARGDGAIFALKMCRLQGPEQKRFAREVRLLRKIKHPHVVPIVHANLSHSPPYFVMPLAVGSLESELLQIKGKEAEALALFREVCMGVQALHDSGIVHRDLKPANVLRLPGGRIVVSDLGLAKLVVRDTSVLTRTRTIVGTLDYLAPEQLLPDGSRRADVRTDIYQLGKMLYQLLTGRSPGLIESAVLPAGLAHIIPRATRVNPHDRYQSLGEFLDALRYYELAKDPTHNTREALESLVLQAEDMLDKKELRLDLLREILALVARIDPRDPSAVMEAFDRLPDGLLPIMGDTFAADFQPVLFAYAEAIRARVARCPFAYADEVARRLRLIFLETRLPELKTLALQTILLAAVELNRFASMGVFNRLLIGVKTLEYAFPIAEMLRDHAEYYQDVAGAIPPDRLHPAIRSVQHDVLEQAEEPF